MRSSTGDNIPNDLPETITYNGDSTINTIAVTDGVSTWVQTFSYTDGKVTGISAWVKQ